MVIALVGLFSYALHARTRYDALDVMLQGDVRHMASALASASTPSAGQQVIAMFMRPGAGGAVYDRHGRVLYASASSDSAAPPLDVRRAIASGTSAAYPVLAVLAPRVFRVTPGDGAFLVVRDESGTRWRAYVVPMARGTQYLAATVPLQPIDRSVATFGRLILLCASLASVAALFVGWLLARQALRPVAVLTASAMARSRILWPRVADPLGRDELDRLANTFHQLLGTQEDAMEAQQRFIAAASHELRAPLTVILANLELLERGAFRMNEHDHAHAVSEAHTEAARMARLVADLLSLARADAGAPLRREPVELDRVLLDVMGEVRHQLDGQRLEIAAFEPVIVRGDPDRLKQLVVILVDNAIKYTSAPARIDASLRRVEGAAILEVRDTGVGIAATDLPRVFERFYRADAGRARNAGGSGLGLSIARWIAGEHGGSVVLASEVGKGTTATIRLPAA